MMNNESFPHRNFRKKTVGISKMIRTTIIVIVFVKKKTLLFNFSFSLVATLPDFPFMSLAFKLRALRTVNVRTEVDG